MRTMAATRVAVYLSLNVEVMDDERGDSLAAVPLVGLTGVVLWLWGLVEMWGIRLEVAVALVEIGYQSVWWGVRPRRRIRWILGDFIYKLWRTCCGELMRAGGGY